MIEEHGLDWPPKVRFPMALLLVVLFDTFRAVCFPVLRNFSVGSLLEKLLDSCWSLVPMFLVIRPPLQFETPASHARNP